MTTHIFLDSKKCRTIGGAKPNVPCIFPFKFEVYIGEDSTKDVHNQCIKDEDEDSFWCSTKVDEEGYHIADSNLWGTCGPGCPGVPAPKGILYIEEPYIYIYIYIYIYYNIIILI